MNKIYIDGNSLTLEEFAHVARDRYQVELKREAIENINKSRELVDKFIEEGRIIYGITTGFGRFSDVVITGDETITLQKKLIMSHACGVGEPLKEEIVRGIMLLRINALAKGYSGIRLSTLETLIEMLNKVVHTIIPEKGSLRSQW